MQETDQILDHLETVFQAWEKHLNGSAETPLHSFQRQSLLDLKRVQFPDRRHEDWKYTAVQRLISPPYQLVTSTPQGELQPIPGLDSYVISVVNGMMLPESITPDLASAGIRVIMLKEAMDQPSWHSTFNPLITYAGNSSNRAFELLNFAFTGHGFVLSIDEGRIIDKPIEIRITHDGPDATFSHPLYFLHAGPGSQCVVIERFEKSERAAFPDTTALINALAFFRLDRNASVQHIKWQDLPTTQNLVYKLLAMQYRDSRLTTYAFDRGGNVVRNNVEVELEDQHTYTSLQAGFLATGTQSMDHQTRINHKKPYCESHELYKGIIDQQASGAFNGKVYVHPDAQKTNAFQQNDALVLSPHAVMNSKPQLEIYADDVRCSHGATIGQLDEKALFYLRTRGLHPDAARHMLKAAFLASVLDAIRPDALRDYIQAKMVSQI